MAPLLIHVGFFLWFIDGLGVCGACDLAAFARSGLWGLWDNSDKRACPVSHPMKPIPDQRLCPGASVAQ